jgi:hypothetical protein
MNNLRIATYLAVWFAIVVHHVPVLRAGFEVQTDVYYNAMAEELGLWD